MSTTSERLAAMEAKFDALIARLNAPVAAQSAPRKSKAADAPRTFATKAERDAGNGFPCTAEPSCGRTNLRTPASGASHDPKAAHWHNAA